KSGYTFAGWYKDQALSNKWSFTTDTVPAADITLYAKWDINQYKVNYDSNGGTAVVSETVEYGKKVAEPAAPTKSGYVFVGWYKDQALSDKWNFTADTVPAADITLYAKWDINQYKVNYDSNGGSAVVSETVEYGKKVVEPAAPTKSGY
ncbi:InlB B-repeat-containing protein, partial [Paenibacillus agri]